MVLAARSGTLASGVFDFLAGLTDWLDEVSSNPWFYAVIFVIALADSVIPVVPSESTVIVGGIAAGQGNLWILGVIVCGATGAFFGDSIAYFLGSRFRPWVIKQLSRSRPGKPKPDGEERLSAAADQIDKRGGLLLITARFIPGGRTLMTVSCGATARPYKAWFVPWDFAATGIWATYGALIGYFFGEVFKDNHTMAFWLAFGTALGVTAVIELVRWRRDRGNAATTTQAGSS